MLPLERQFAAFMRVSFALAVTSCSSALVLSLRTLDIKPGGKVLVPAFAFAAVPSAIVQAGCEPVPVEVGDTYRIDMADFEAKLDNADAVIVSHMRGHASDMDAIMRLCDARGIPVVEDAAHSRGTLWDGRMLGTIGSIGCFGFQSMKDGEIGMLVTGNPDIFARAVALSGDDEHKWRNHADAIVHEQIGDSLRSAREGSAGHDYIASILNASHWLYVPPQLPKEDCARDCITFNLRGFITDEEAAAFRTAADARGVAVEIFGLSKDNERVFWNWRSIGRDFDLPKTRNMLMRACEVRLPAHPSREDLDFVAMALLRAAEDVILAGLKPKPEPTRFVA